MSRRPSRVSLADRQNETLQEFESLKRKYLQYNKAIIKENTQLRIQIEDLKGQISQLYVENLALGKSNISLEKQLRQERTANKGRKLLEQADTVTASLISQLEAFRKALHAPPQTTPSSSPDTTPPVIREKPIASTRPNLLARAPDFSLIVEDEEEEDIGLQPIPSADPQPPVTTAPAPQREELPKTSNITMRRKPTRRESGLFKPTSKTSAIEEPPVTQDEAEVADLLADGVTSAPDVVSEAPVSKGKRKSRASGAPRGLVDVTNSPPRQGTKNTPPPTIMGVLSGVSADEETEEVVKHVKAPRKSRATNLRAPASDPEPPIRPMLAPPSGEASGSDNGEPSAARPTRARKSVNYAEPKLNIKMRKPDEPAPTPYAYASLELLAATLPQKRPARPTSTESSEATGSLQTNPVVDTPVPVRPIKPLPNSLAKIKPMKTAKEVKSPFAEDLAFEPEPEAGPSKPVVPLPAPKEKVASFRAPAPPVVEDEEEEEETDAPRTEDSDSEVSSDGVPTPKRSPKRKASKVLDEFKSASLSSSVGLTKHSRLNKSTSGDFSSHLPLPTSSSHRPSGATSSTRLTTEARPTSTLPSFTKTSSTSTTTARRSAVASKYDYFDVSDEDAAAAGDDDDDWMPKKTITSSTKLASGNRRHSTNV